MKSKAGIFIAALLVAPAVAALAAIVSAQESEPTDVPGEMLTCPSGDQVQSRFALNGDAWEVTGILQAGLTGTITVSGPTGDVSVTPTINLVITGEPQLGQPVTMSGTVAMTGEMVATSILNACLGAPTDSPSPTPGEDPAGQPVSDDDEDEANDESDEDDGNSEDSAGNEKIAEAIAAEFDTTPDEVLALHGEGIGFGAIFKLYLIARANDITVPELLAQIEEDGGGSAFGKLQKSLTEEETAIFEDGPKNLGELISGSNHDDDDSDDDEDDTSRSGSRSNGKSKGDGKKD